MESNNKKGPQKRLSKSHFLRQTDISRKIGQIIDSIPEDNEYLVDLFLEQFYALSLDENDTWGECLIDFINNAFVLQDIEKINLLLEKIQIEKISFVQMDCLVRSCFRYSRVLPAYKDIILEIYEEMRARKQEIPGIFHGLFSVENGVLKIKTL